MAKSTLCFIDALTLSIFIFAHVETINLHEIKATGPTQSYLTIRELRDAVKVTFNDPLGPKSPYKNLIASMIKREKEFSSTHYVFYHGQSGNYRIVQDLMRSIIKKINPERLKEDFIYLRPWSNDEMDDPKMLDVQLFIDAVEKIVGPKFNDAIPLLSELLLAVNLSLFGNTQQADYLESSFHYFINNRSGYSDNVENILKGIFKKYKLDLKLLPGLLEFNQKFNSSGSLIQIFIPKNKVNQCVYLAHSRSTPHRRPIIASLFDSEKKRHREIAAIFDLYKDFPRAIEDIDKLQARILLPCLNQIQGVKMFRYTHHDTNIPMKLPKN